MKYSSIIAFFLATAVSTSQSVATETQLSGEDEARTPVRINVNCVGADLSALSLPRGSAVGRILEGSYNEVVSGDDEDDSDLGSVTFSGTGRRGSKSGLWNGYWECELCVKDTSAATKAWESTFVAGLVASGDEGFRGVKSCSIALTVGAPTNGEVVPNADIIVNCGKSLDLSLLSVAQGTFLAHAVQRSYGKVHGNIVDDDSSLDSVYYRESSKKLFDSSIPSLSRKPRPANLNGLWWICRMCPPGDDDLSLGMEVTGANLMDWQGELVTMLRQSNFDKFRKVTKCLVKLMPHEASAYEEEPDEINIKPSGGVRGGCAIE